MNGQTAPDRLQLLCRSPVRVSAPYTADETENPALRKLSAAVRFSEVHDAVRKFATHTQHDSDKLHLSNVTKSTTPDTFTEVNPQGNA